MNPRGSAFQVRGRAAAVLPELSELQGATLEWWGLVVSHGLFRLLASGLQRGTAEIRMVGLTYLDLPVVVHGVRFSVATAVQAERVGAAAHPELAEDLRPEDVLVIDCDEGSFLVWAQGPVTVHWIRAPDTAFLDRINKNLWPAGLDREDTVG